MGGRPFHRFLGGGPLGRRYARRPAPPGAAAGEVFIPLRVTRLDAAAGVTRARLQTPLRAGDIKLGDLLAAPAKVTILDDTAGGVEVRAAVDALRGSDGQPILHSRDPADASASAGGQTTRSRRSPAPPPART